MRIIHNISLNVDAQKERAFSEAGVALHPEGPPSLVAGLATFRISEDDPRWPEVRALMEAFQIMDVSWTRFSASELDSARFLVLGITRHQGYPQPDHDFGYRNITYDCSDFCEACGTGLRQIAPFRFLRPPTWGKKSVLQLNWVFDEYFVKPDVWRDVFKPLGVASLPVLLHKTGEVIDSVVQI